MNEKLQRAQTIVRKSVLVENSRTNGLNLDCNDGSSPVCLMVESGLKQEDPEIHRTTEFESGFGGQHFGVLTQ